MGKKVMIVGAGVQGSTIARRLNGVPAVDEIVCADYNLRSIDRLEDELTKVQAVKVDGKNIEQVMDAAKGAYLLINALPPEYNLDLMEAALRSGTNYMDLASGPVKGVDFVEAVNRQLKFDKAFNLAGLTALINAGSAPGLSNVIARHSADKLDACERIDIYIYDGVWAKKFTPFWWSPETAFGDMASDAIVYVEGKYKRVPPFSNPEWIELRNIGKCRVVDHQHEEVVTFGIFFKGLQMSTFKYGGPACEFAEFLYRLGLLDKKVVEIDGVPVAPFDVTCKLSPPAPSTPEEIENALSEGLEMERGAALIRVSGRKNGQTVCFDNYIRTPGLKDCFEKFGMTHEAFVTGQSAFLFAKLIINGDIRFSGVCPPEILDENVRQIYLSEAAALGIIVDEIKNIIL